MIKKFALGVAAAVTIALSASGPANAQVCARNVVTAVGKTSLTAIGARLSARNTWRTTVRRQLGPRYASVSRARGARDICRKVGARTSCRFIARPCRT
ncbi:MAG: hypothetical protein J0I57_04305 [Hyphomicrobium sp.]|nr:hypothetical protein [Hyphomicrobium sp.]MBN9276839.1 hypothetical protein [Hyphomicrobium sp.]ODT30216.1 MAG: hypothetical protein ABS54_03110 [Hyphomicrobium sp. SCN 65-11]